MKKFILFSLLLIISAASLADERVAFSKEITERSIKSLEKSILKKIKKIKPDENRVLVIDLASNGGDIQAAINFVKRVEEISTLNNVEINTRVNNGKCESACTILFTAGHKRIAYKKSYFGFHAPTLQSKLPAGKTLEEVLEWARSIWINAIAAVDNQLPYVIKERELLYSKKMIYLRGHELTSGYVNELK